MAYKLRTSKSKFKCLMNSINCMQHFNSEKFPSVSVISSLKSWAHPLTFFLPLFFVFSKTSDKLNSIVYNNLLYQTCFG